MLNINTLNMLDLGVQWENKAKTITIDISPWLEEYPNGNVYIWHKRNGEDSVYNPVYQEMDTAKKTIAWMPSSIDTFYAGYGMCGICLSEGDVIKRTKNIRTYVFETDNVNPGTPQGLLDYENLDNLPQINGITLKGNKSFTDLGMFDDTGTRDDLAVSAKKAEETYSKQEDIAEAREGLEAAIAMSESETKASRDITEGEYLVWKGTIYEAKTDIPANATIVPGTHLSDLPKGGLNALRADILAATEEKAAYHLGFYIDADGDINQVDDEE